MALIASNLTSGREWLSEIGPAASRSKEKLEEIASWLVLLVCAFGTTGIRRPPQKQTVERLVGPEDVEPTKQLIQQTQQLILSMGVPKRHSKVLQSYLQTGANKKPA